jgi:hypothetical protein
MAEIDFSLRGWTATSAPKEVAVSTVHEKQGQDKYASNTKTLFFHVKSQA